MNYFLPISYFNEANEGLYCAKRQLKGFIIGTGTAKKISDKCYSDFKECNPNFVGVSEEQEEIADLYGCPYGLAIEMNKLTYKLSSEGHYNYLGLKGEVKKTWPFLLDKEEENKD